MMMFFSFLLKFNCKKKKYEKKNENKQINRVDFQSCPVGFTNKAYVSLNNLTQYKESSD